MAYIVTGGAGFIGSNMVKYLNNQGLNDIIIIDTYNNKKMQNLHDLTFKDFIDYKDGIDKCINYISKINRIEAFFHIGANADVLVYDEKEMMNENFEYSRAYCNFCMEKGIPFIYASSSAVYGNSKEFKLGVKNEMPHNTYSWSKWLFDRYVEENFLSDNKYAIYGFRFFNVFGMGEFHKGKNACIANRFVSFIKEKGYIDLFEDTIKRDYVYVEDLVHVLFDTYKQKPVVSGIYNLGGGHQISHRQIAEYVVKTYYEKGKLHTPLEEAIKTIPMPSDLKNKFQFETMAMDMPSYIRNITINNEDKMKKYISDLIDMDFYYKD
ncbi:NAD-dependent epimerase/dehydratase family protein [Bacteroides ilei]|uniref:NAD-dependent epimerase/dehydratase family protein n=1 Tax=Bacteroides ilei TaxID=1907658 RepID=UPI000930C2E0|nr:NAD-dependent epimerase/dehydratase family protein [Bacteroides ilei]